MERCDGVITAGVVGLARIFNALFAKLPETIVILFRQASVTIQQKSSLSTVFSARRRQTADIATDLKPHKYV